MHLGCFDRLLLMNILIVHTLLQDQDGYLDNHKKEFHHYQDRKSTRLNSSHVRISYAVFCLKKKIIKPESDAPRYRESVTMAFRAVAPEDFLVTVDADLHRRGFRAGKVAVDGGNLQPCVIA